MYDLAYNLRMPLNRLLDELTYDEFQGWMAYFESRPVDWRDDDRAFKYMQTQGVKQKPWEVFPSLAPIYKPNKGDKFDVSGFKSSMLFHKMLGAKSGDKLDL